MRIAVLIAGHIRTWEYCKENFLNTIIQDGYDVDVFIDTYDEVYRTDYPVRNENSLRLNRSSSEILNLMDGLPVKYFNVEPEICVEAEYQQIRKLRQLYLAFEDYEYSFNMKYDLCIKTRFDIQLKQKLDYEFLYSKKDELFIADTKSVNVGRFQNDLFCVTGRRVFNQYIRRFDIDIPTIQPYYGVHGTLTELINRKGIIITDSIDIVLVRNDNGNIVGVG